MKLYSKEELKDSRIFFDKNPPRFMNKFILFLVFITMVFFIFSYNTKKNYIVKASGIIETTDNRYISVNVGGEVKSIEKTEGSYVKQDEILFTISNGSENEQSESLQPLIDKITEKSDSIDLFNKSLKDNKNYLKNEGSDQAYFGKMEYYISIVERERYLKDDLSKQLNIKEDEIKMLNLDKTEFEREMSDALITEGEKEILSDKIKNTQNVIKEAESNIEQMKQQLNDPSSESIKMRQQLLSELGAEKQSVEEQLAQLLGQQKLSDIENNDKQIKAVNEGYIHYLIPLKEGLSVQLNQTIATISKNESKSLVAEVNVPASDITKIENKQEVIIEVQGVNSQKFGTLHGLVETISNGTFIQETEQGNILYYQAIISLNETELVSSDGEIISIIKSMPIEAKVVYNKETYFDWFLKLFGFTS